GEHQAHEGGVDVDTLDGGSGRGQVADQRHREAGGAAVDGGQRPAVAGKGQPVGLGRLDADLAAGGGEEPPVGEHGGALPADEDLGGGGQVSGGCGVADVIAFLVTIVRGGS